MKKIIELKVNGELHEVAVHPWQTLLDVLRRDLAAAGCLSCSRERDW